MAKQSSFFEGPVKRQNKKHKDGHTCAPKWSPTLVPLSPICRQRWERMRHCSPVGALWCSRVPPDTFFGDFRSDSGWIWHVFQNVFVALPLPKNLRSIVSPIRRKAFRSTFLARPGHKICTDSHNPSAAFLLEGRWFRETSSIYKN